MPPHGQANGAANGHANGGSASPAPPSPRAEPLQLPPHCAPADVPLPPPPSPSQSTGLLAARCWYLWTYSAQALLLPFMNLFFLAQGLSQRQVGSLMALRPWTAAIAGNCWALLADSTQAHRTILLLTYAAIPGVRYALTAVKGYAPTLALVLLMESVGAPVNIIVDAATMAAGEDEGAYGRTRVWGAVGWGLCSPLGGWIVARFGLKAAFAANCGGWAAGLGLTALLPVSALGVDAAGDRARRAARRRASAAAHDAARAERRGRATPPPRAPTPPVAVRAVAGGTEDAAAAAAAAVAAGLSSSLPLATAPEVQAYDADALLARKAAARRRASLSAEGGEGDAAVADIERPLLPSSEDGGGGDRRRRPPPATADCDHHRPSSAASASPSSSAALSPRSAAAPPLPPCDAAAATAAAAAAAALPTTSKLAVILSQPGALPFFATCLVFGYAMGTIDSWLFVFLDGLGAPPTLMGATLTVTCAVEAPVFFFAGRLLAAVGTQAVLRMVWLAFLARLLAYWALPLLGSPYFVLPVETLHGITFGCAWAAGTAQCARLAPPGLEATTQAVFTGLYMGAGLGLGGLVGGCVHAALGPRAVFLVAAGVVAAAWALISAAQALLGGKADAAADDVEGVIVAHGTATAA